MTVKFFEKELEADTLYSLNFDNASYVDAAVIAELQRQFNRFFLGSGEGFNASEIVEKIGTELGEKEVLIELDDDEFTLKGTFKQRLKMYIHRVYSNVIRRDSYQYIIDTVVDSAGLGSYTDMKFMFSSVIDWYPGEFGDGGSCWWGSYYRGRAVHEYEMRRGNAYALKVWVDGRNAARAWVVPYQGMLIFFNTYIIGRLNDNQLYARLAKFFGVKATVFHHARFHRLQHGNLRPWALHNIDTIVAPDMTIYDNDWSSYKLDDRDYELYTADQIIDCYREERENAGYDDSEDFDSDYYDPGEIVECCKCKMPRLTSFDYMQQVLPHCDDDDKLMCEMCYTNINAFSLNDGTSRVYDPIYYERVVDGRRLRAVRREGVEYVAD